MLIIYLVIILFLGTPVLLWVLFGTYLCLYLVARRKNKVNPGSVSNDVLITRAYGMKTWAISAVVATTVILGILFWFTKAIENM